MSTQIIAIHECDECHRTRWTTEPLSLPGEGQGETFTLDLGEGLREMHLCADCQDGLLWVTMVDLYHLDGRPIGKSKGPAKAPSADSPQQIVRGPRVTVARWPQPCPLCDDKKSYSEYAAARLHMMAEHTFDPNLIEPLECPLCDVELKKGTGSLVGLHRHVRVAHDESLLSAIKLALSKGDPRGVVAGIRERSRAAKLDVVAAANNVHRPETITLADL